MLQFIDEFVIEPRSLLILAVAGKRPSQNARYVIIVRMLVVQFIEQLLRPFVVVEVNHTDSGVEKYGTVRLLFFLLYGYDLLIGLQRTVVVAFGKKAACHSH